MTCIWIDIVWQNASVYKYIRQAKIYDDRAKRHVMASLFRLVPYHDVGILYFDTSDVAVVKLTDFQYNKQLQKAVMDVYKLSTNSDIKDPDINLVIKDLLSLMLDSELLKLTEIEFE